MNPYDLVEALTVIAAIGIPSAYWIGLQRGKAEEAELNRLWYNYKATGEWGPSKLFPRPPSLLDGGEDWMQK